jgi:colicin import membrane protein
MSSEYEHNVGKLLSEKRSRLDTLKKNEDQNKYEIQSLVSEIDALESLFENYNLGMNVFRRAKGGRSGLRE